MEKQAKHGLDRLNKPRAGLDEDRSARPRSDQRDELVESWIRGEPARPLEAYTPSLVGSYNFRELVSVAHL